MAAHIEEKPEGAPEWMVSFADMITIMMSFFVIMFALASSEAAKGKHSKQQQAAMDSLANRFGPKYQPFASWGLLPGNVPVKNGGDHQKTKNPSRPPTDPAGDVKVLKKEQARIRVPGSGQHVVIGGIVFFDDLSKGLADEQKARLKVIAEEIVGKPQQVEILGHASARPLPAGSSYRDRWDLAYARCRQAAEVLTSLKIDPQRLRIGVIQSSGAQAVGNGTSPGEDSQVDVYLSDVVPDKFTASK
jgi:chemotaxis protein MotB